MTVLVRPRVDSDVDQVVRLAALVQATDGYPGRPPSDVRTFMFYSDALGAIVGHVALHGRSMPVVMARASESLGREAGDLAVVARLIVDPAARRLGVGRALLGAAADEARRRARHPILDVVTHYAAANALYRSCGWRNVGEVTMVFRDRSELQSYIYVAPDA
jgi:GNAT superfamily N-acetyltransferase